jgi:hypothetical protein
MRNPMAFAGQHSGGGALRSAKNDEMSFSASARMLPPDPALPRPHQRPEDPPPLDDPPPKLPDEDEDESLLREIV